MKREHKIQSNQLLDFLRAKNCIFYLPLRQDDTAEFFSGNNMIKYANNSVVWDSALNMWKFTYVSGQQPAINQYYAKWSLAQPIQSNTPKIYTVVSEYYPYDSATWSSVMTSAVYDYLPTNYGMSLSGVTGQLNNSAHIWAEENNETHQKFYRNGQIVYDQISQDNLLAYEDLVIIGNMRETKMKKRYGIRNFAIFLGVALTQSEIDEYFSLI